jgi:hypothetical protein
MDMKQANLSFHYAERVKSNIFLASGALDGLERAREQEGGREVAVGVFSALRGEINIAKRFLPPREMDLIEEKIVEAEGQIMLQDYEKARLRLSEALSQVTTLCGRYIVVLMEGDLI